ncbi:Wall-associated receptor kinase-like 8 [Morella rubra]|uniref:Wall-associated receptor kinase-like 8 n=1 Tax=Morella rubra TaxID=262757 RepID=A0A6A1VCQ4_9ROSI|nr:Wall-associated receptor kinase-like 8 [Morella rubra]
MVHRDQQKMVLQMMFQMILLLQSMNAFAQPAVASLAKDPSCEDHCGKVTIPNFHTLLEYELDVTLTAFWQSGSFNLEALNISAEDRTLRVNYPIFRSCVNVTSSKLYVGLDKGPFYFSLLRNSFIAMGCNSALIRSPDGSSITGGCKTLSCNKRAPINASSCNGTNCCQTTTIPLALDAFITEIQPINYTSEDSHAGYCNYAFLVEQAWLETARTFTDIFHKNMSHVPVVLDWGIDRNIPVATGKYSPKYRERSTACGFESQRDLYTCSCQYGFEGNPYLVCRDIDECANPAEANYRCGNKRCHNIDGSYLCIGFPVEAIVIGISTGLGLIVLLVGGWLSYKVVKRKMMIKRKEKFFKRNGGLLLVQQLSSSEHNTENPNLFTLKDLEKATDQFNENRILGDGGQGTVYKGMLLDGRIVAIKKSKVIDEVNLKEFINELALLSRINHRNV